VSFTVVRSKRARGELLRWRISAFLLGAILGLTGIFLNSSWLVIVALVVLFGGILLRMIPSNDISEDEPPERSN